MTKNPNVVFSRGKSPSAKRAGAFICENDKTRKRKSKNGYNGKVYILINENTGSTGEFLTMYLKSSINAVLIGQNSAGADGNMVLLQLPGLIKTSFSGIGIYNPDGTKVQSIGIKPDFFVPRTYENIISGEDYILKYAIDLIHKN